MNKNQGTNPNQTKTAEQNRHFKADKKQGVSVQEPVRRASPSLNPKPSQQEQERKNIKEAPSNEDWEGGASRPARPEVNPGDRPEDEREHPYPRPVEAGEEKQDKDTKQKKKDWPKGDVC